MNMEKLLVVVDMQNDFIDGALGSPQAQAIVDKVCAKIDGWDGQVVYTQDTHTQNDYSDTAEGKRIIPHCVHGTDGWELNPYILRRAGTIMYKHAFGIPELANKVSYNGITDVQFVGLCTDICVISNALMLRSICPCVSITVDASCCAGTSKEAHEAALLVMSRCAIDIIGG